MSVSGRALEFFFDKLTIFEIFFLVPIAIFFLSDFFFLFTLELAQLGGVSGLLGGQLRNLIFRFSGRSRRFPEMDF